MVRKRVFMDFTANNEPLGRVIFELYNDIVPRTAENFRSLCTGEKGLSPLSDRPLYYKNSPIHRSIPGFMVQGGDFTKMNGSGGESIYGGPFHDEDLSTPLDSEGLLCMANKGPNTNGSQFFVTLVACPHLNGKHVVFGRVIRGYDVIEKIAAVPVGAKDRPSVPIVVSSCGELELRKPPAQTQREASPVSESEEESDSGDDRFQKHKRKRRRSHTRSDRDDNENSASEDDDKERRHKKHKHRRHKHKSRKHRRDEKADEDAKAKEAAAGTNAEPRKETEEEYDARLEREENERKEAARLRELERLARRAAEPEPGPGEVRFKGRGRMKYLDPELRRY